MLFQNLPLPLTQLIGASAIPDFVRGMIDQRDHECVDAYRHWYEVWV
jgi:hypothetical protein